MSKTTTDWSIVCYQTARYCWCGNWQWQKNCTFACVPTGDWTFWT